MGYDYYCLLGTAPEESPLTRDEIQALVREYQRCVAEEYFPRVGVVEHGGSGSLSCGITARALGSLQAISAAVPARRLVLWCIHFDLTGVSYVEALAGRAAEEVCVAPADTFTDGPRGCQLMASYPIGCFTIAHDLGPWLEKDYSLITTGSAAESGSASDED